MAKSAKHLRAAKAARRVLRNLQVQLESSSNKRRRTASTSVEAAEATDTATRLARDEETKKRNAVAQIQPRVAKRNKKRESTQDGVNEARNKDADSFFSAIDSPFLRICGSCGELSKSEQAVVQQFDPQADRFAPLRNTAGVCEVINEGVFTEPSTGSQMIWLCRRCNNSLREKKIPKFCRASGFRIAPVPSELAVLNRMEARLIGLGVSFTTCVNLYCDGQEFTRGNAINYWNDAVNVVLELPRPLSKCGIVYLKAQNTKSSPFFRVRPHLVRRALSWLIEHNPLYKKVKISEANLAALQAFDVDTDIPSITLTEEEVHQLRPTENQANAESVAAVEDHDFETHQADLQSPSSSENTPNTCFACHNPYTERCTAAVLTQNTGCVCHCNKTNTSKVGFGSPTTIPDVLSDLTETFELERNEHDTQSELEKILQAANIDSLNYPIQELRCHTDPINEYETKMLMQSCFPTLFPNAEGGFNSLAEVEVRTYEPHLAEYCAHLMKWHDRRYVIHRNFKFFCLNLIQRRQIDGLVRRVGPVNNDNSTDDGIESVTPKDKDVSTAMQVLESLKPYFRVVRGSGLYWSNVRDDLMSMIGSRVLPTRWPTFFLTLSAADTIWPDFFRACNPELTLENCRHLPAKERRRMLNENPDIAARFFNHRFQAFFDSVLCGNEKPLGEIVDFFWRVEFQQRGSPHIHALLWIENAPDVLELSETDEGRAKLAKFIDNSVSVLSHTMGELDACPCNVCIKTRTDNMDIIALRPPSSQSNEWQCDVSRLVQRVQQHICYAGASCRKKGNECRFGYPKELQPHTTIDASIASDGTPSLKVKLKRDVSTINNYSPALLSTWRANMDIQLIGNAYGAAEYAGAYVSKAEPDTTRFRKVITKAVKRCDVNLPHHAILKRVANAALSIREVSAQEAYFILLRELPMHGKSRTVTRVKVLRHDMRCYRVDTRERQDITDFAGSVLRTSIRIEPAERAYMNRPFAAQFDNMSFATFVEEYDYVEKVSVNNATSEHWKRTDGEGFIKRRAKPHVLRMSPYISPDVKNSNFCYAELFLHTPWRELSDLPQTDSQCIAEFLREQEKTLDNELRLESNAKITRQHNLELLKHSNVSHCCQHLPPSEYVFVEEREALNGDQHINSMEAPAKESIAANWLAKHAYSPEDIQKARSFVKTFVKPFMKEKREISNFNERNGNMHRHQTVGVEDISTMSDSQWLPFALAMSQSRARFRSKLERIPCAPLLLIINGEGGSGKSWLIEHIVRDVRNVFYDSNEARSSERVLLLAHQGTAAFNIKGQTLCSALGFSSFSKSAFSVPYISLTAQKNGASKLNSLQQRYRDIHLVIIDEFSVISCGMLYWIDQRMREIWPQDRHLRFGGRDVIFTGDAAQLDPVVPYSLSTPTQKIQNDVQRKGRELWEGIECVCTLTTQNRGKSDPEWFDALRRLRRRRPTPADIDLFNTRCNTEKSIPSSFSRAKHIAHKNIDVDAANHESLLAADMPIVHIYAQHHVQQKRLHRQRTIPEGTVEALVNEAKHANSDRDRVVSTKLKLCVGAPVTLTFNLEQSAGLCNGTNAIVYDLIFVSDSELPIILVQITDPYLGPSFLDNVPNIVPITTKEVSWGKKNSDFRVIRRGIPLRLAYAMTIHKVQGLTCDQVIFHCNSIPSVAFAYVALSRVRERTSIILTQPLTYAKLQTPSERLVLFEAEESRVAVAVAETINRTIPIVRAMKIVAHEQRAAILPRS